MVIQGVQRIVYLTLLFAGFAAAGNTASAWIGEPTGEPPAEYVMRDALVLDCVGRYGRWPLYPDALEAMIVADRWTAPRPGDTVTLPDGKEQTWTEATAGKNNWLELNALKGGYAYWTVNSPVERVMILDAAGHSSVRANGEPRSGDVYGYGYVQLPVLMKKGANEFLFHCKRGRLRARLAEPKTDVYIELRDPTLPDLILGEDWASRGAVVIVNATGEFLDDLTISAGGSGLPMHETKLPVIAPLTVRKVPFWLGGAVSPQRESCRITLELSRDTNGVKKVIDTARFTLKVRSPHSKHNRTYLSEIDGSVQYYAVMPMQPPASAPDEPVRDAPWPALFLSLHGAGVEASGQAGVYKPKDWGYVVAATNRRPYGHDWEDWGRLDTIEVLQCVERLFNIDPNRIYLTGHSMGGHGTWQIGATLPDRFAAIGPSAGWVSFWSYVGAVKYDDPSPIEQIMLRAISPSDTAALSRNYLHHGIYILHGDKDDNVPVEEARSRALVASVLRLAADVRVLPAAHAAER